MASDELKQLGSWLEGLWFGKATRYVSGYLPDQADPINPNEKYLTIDVESFWIPVIRKGLTTFYGAVHGNVEMTDQAGKNTKFEMFDLLGKSRVFDKKSFERVVQGPFPLVDAVPYRGGRVKLDVALFSIKEQFLAGDYLNLLKKMSTVAGIAFAPQVMPFANLISEGLSKIAGGDNFEIGRAGSLDALSPGRYAVVRADATEVALQDLTYDETTRALLRKGKPIDSHAYMVLNFKASERRDGFGNIPDVKKAFEAMKERFGKKPINLRKNNEAFDHFAVTVELSADFLKNDGKRLITDVQAEYDRFLTQRLSDGDVQKSEELLLSKELKDFNPFRSN